MLFKHMMSYRLTANHLTINTSMMKYFTLLKNFLYLALLLSSPFAFSQNVGVNSSGSAPDASAGLDVSFTDKGLLVPRVTLTGTNDVTTIASPATSLLVYNTVSAGSAPNQVIPGFYYFNGTVWARLVTNTLDSQWTTVGSNIYYATGKVGLGLTNPSKQLHVGGTTAVDSSLHVDFTDSNTGTSTSGLAFGSTAGEGIASKRNSGGNFKGLDFYTNNANRLAITNSGNIGIGLTEPTYKLQIGAVANPLFLSGVQDGSTSDSILTITNGLVKKLPQSGLLTTSWGLTGNTGTSSNFIGTTNNEHLRFRTNNTQALMVDSLGNVGIGASPIFNASARAKLLVDIGGSQEAADSSSYNGLVVKGYSPSYLQLNVQNKYSGTTTSTDVVATADNGSESDFYVDMGINSSGSTAGYFGSANDAYLYNKGQDLLIGTATSGKNLRFFSGGGNSSNERMRINGINGNIGIGTGSSSPAYRLQVVASSNPLALSGVQTGTGDTILTISGTGVVQRAIRTNILSQTWSLSGNNITSGQKFGTTNSQALVFITGTGGSEKMRISTSGLVGINAGTSPTNRLHVADTADPLRLVGVQSDTVTTVLTISNTGVVKSISKGNLVSQNWNFSGNSLSSNQKLGTTSNHALPFITNGVERMRISQSGNIGIGTDAPNTRLHIVSSDDEDPITFEGLLNDEAAEKVLTITTDGIVKQTLKSSINDQTWSLSGNEVTEVKQLGTTSNYDLSLIAAGSEKMRITTAGSVTIGDIPDLDQNYLLTVGGYIKCAGVNNASDRRLKKNIQNLNYGLKDVVALQPVTYNWIDPKQTDKTQIGLIAQDLKPIIPELVNGDEEKGKLSVNYIGLVPVLINAIKEQQSKLDAQQKQIDELKELVQKSLSNK